MCPALVFKALLLPTSMGLIERTPSCEYDSGVKPISRSKLNPVQQSVLFQTFLIDLILNINYCSPIFNSVIVFPSILLRVIDVQINLPVSCREKKKRLTCGSKNTRLQDLRLASILTQYKHMLSYIQKEIAW